MSLEAWQNLAGILQRGPATFAIVPQFNEAFACLRDLPDLVVFTPLKHDFEKFRNAAVRVTSEFPRQRFQQVLFVPTKNKIESLGYIHQGLELLEESGSFLFACDNDCGAKSFMALLQQLDPDLEFESKRKGRFTSFKKSQLKTRQDESWVKDFDFHVTELGFTSFPGIYGWNKIDHASRLLLSTLPPLRGLGADFGSGYGYLPSQMDLSSVTQMHLLENDSRALEASRRNLVGLPQCRFHWVDVLTDELALPPLDFIVMNPPFHEGKEVQQSLGEGFIKRARGCLKESGRLFLVANQFLSYEDVLQTQFGRVERVLKQDGFKVLHV